MRRMRRPGLETGEESLNIVPSVVELTTSLDRIEKDWPAVKNDVNGVDDIHGSPTQFGFNFFQILRK